MDFRLLGPVEAWSGETQVNLGGPKPRALLAALLLEHGRVVSTDRLIDVIWGEEPPSTARALIQTYVAALRRSFTAAGEPELIETRPPGYRVDLTRRLDLAEYEELTLKAGSAPPPEAARLFKLADELWRGNALGGIGDALTADAERLNELRLAALEDRIEAELELGRHGALASEIGTTLARHPHRERLRGQLMIALCRTGQQAEALAIYAEGRELLAEELGVDPSPELQRLYEAVLHNDSSIFAASKPAPQQHLLVPAQLPAGVADFTGRETEVGTLLNRYAERSSAGVVDIQVISGPGGVGKSTLALQIAHQVASQFPAGQLYADLGGVTELPGSPSDLLARFLRALGTDQQAIPPSLEERVDLYRSITAGRQLLVVLDDAASEQQVRPLLPGAGGAAVILTSRRRLSGLAGAEVTDLSVLNVDDALALLARVAGRERVQAEPEQARRIVCLCGCLPLAVRTAGARLAGRRHWPLVRYATRLADERQRLDELSAGDVEVRASLALSYQGLDDLARLAFRRLGLLSMLDFAPWIAGPLLDLPAEEAEDVVEQLVDAQLLDLATVDALGQVRYRMHELLQVYAREQAAALDPIGDSEAAVTRALRSWLGIVTALSAHDPSGEIDLLPPDTISLPLPADLIEPALENPAAWFDTETPSLLACVDRAASMGLAGVASEVAAAMCSSSFVVANRFDDWWQSHESALAAARQAGDHASEAMLLAGLGRLRAGQDDYAGASSYFEESFARYAEVGDRRGKAAALAGLGDINRELGAFSLASEQLTGALEIFRSLGDDAGRGFCGRRAGAIAAELGDTAAGVRMLEEALAAYRRLRSRRGEAITLRTISLAYRADGDYERARELSAEALQLLDELGDVVMAAYAVQSLAKARIRLRDTDGVAAQLADALACCRQYHDRFGEALMLRTIGEYHLAEGSAFVACGFFEESLAIWRALGVPMFVARTERDLEAARAGCNWVAADLQ